MTRPASRQEHPSLSEALGQAGRRPATRQLSGEPQAWDQPPGQGARSSLWSRPHLRQRRSHSSCRDGLCVLGELVTVSEPQFPYP